MVQKTQEYGTKIFWVYVIPYAMELYVIPDVVELLLVPDYNSHIMDSNEIEDAKLV